MSEVDETDQEHAIPTQWLVIQPNDVDLALALGVARPTPGSWRRQASAMRLPLPAIRLPALWALWAGSALRQSVRRGRELWPPVGAIRAALGLSVSPRPASELEGAAPPGSSAYDVSLPAPATWDEACSRERALGQELDNRARRGELLDPAAVKAQLDRSFDAIEAQLEAASMILVGDDLTIEQRTALAGRVAQWQRQAREALAAAQAEANR